jgi:2-oxoglutarate ferredoxin oxidoreductase subunit gamma
MIEVLSTCPVNWGVKPKEALDWVKDNMIPVFPLGVFKDVIRKMIRTIRISGFGGQGVMLTGQLLAHAANEQGLYSLWVPTYGPETRGGTANCSITISDKPIYSPVFQKSDDLLIFNEPSLAKFGEKIKSGGNIFYNSSLIKKK